MDNTEKSIIKKIETERPLVYFSAVFIVSFVVLALLGSVLVQPVKAVYRSVGSSVMNSIVNKKPELMHVAEVIDDPQSANSIKINIQYHEKVNDLGVVPVKYIIIDIFREAYIPLIFTLALILATPIPIRRRLISLGYGFLIAQAYIFIKLFVLAFDNYRSPDFIVTRLPGLIDFFVYLSSKFLAITGFSSTIILPLVFWIIATFRTKEIEALKGWFATRVSLASDQNRK
jgi:hypothetical protein